MRVWILLASVFGIGTAQAADLPLISQGGGSYMSLGGSYTLAEPASPLVVYDFEPGVVIRAYWLPPWRHRHFFPATGRAPMYGRREYLAPDGPHEPAESYYRSRSSACAFPNIHLSKAAGEHLSPNRIVGAGGGLGGPAVLHFARRVRRPG